MNDEAKACGEKKNPLTKTDNANGLQSKLADYYGLNLDVSTVAKVVSTKIDPQSLDGAIWKRQWAHLCALGDTFVNPDLQHDIQAVLSTQQGQQAGIQAQPPPPPVDCSAETICAWVAAAKDVDVDALAHLFELQSTISGALSKLSPPPTHHQAATSSLATLVPPSHSVTRAHIGHTGSFEDQASLLEACSYDIKALQQANSLDEAIAQVERGDVAEICKQYGPQGVGLVQFNPVADGQEMHRSFTISIVRDTLNFIRDGHTVIQAKVDTPSNAAFLVIWATVVSAQRFFDYLPSLFSICLVRLAFTAVDGVLGTLVSFSPLQSPWSSVTQGPFTAPVKTFLAGETLPVEQIASLSSSTTLPMDWDLWH
ncbi:hypothetical protein BGW80DRAFT_1455245 [Lactifluus volemus]|nr:hypothetical protein BGW80DRAFT_1455245 [Lactifluus volemus]